MTAGMGFDDAEIDYVNKHFKAQEMGIRLADKQVSEEDVGAACVVTCRGHT